MHARADTALDDQRTVLEDSGPSSFDVLVNDSIHPNVRITFVGWNGTPNVTLAGGQVVMDTTVAAGPNRGKFTYNPPEVTDRKATRAELEADLESEEGHVHGPGCGHDHAQEAKPAKAPKAKKAKADDKPEPKPAAKPARKVKLTEDAGEKPKPAKPLKSEPANKAAAKSASQSEAKKPAGKKAKPAK